jgi:sulfate/thiosulfate transport system substrate-binding protein
VAESNGSLQIVYPPLSILAEPYVAWVDSAVAADGNLALAKAYLTFLFSDVAQNATARLGYRPVETGIAAFPNLTLVPVTAIARDWDDASDKFFAENGVIDTILGNRQR